MHLPRLLRAEFIQRENRFLATVRVAGSSAGAHLANSGRLTDLLIPGQRVWLAPSTNPRRVTRYDLKLVEQAGRLVSVDARLPNQIFSEAFQSGHLQELDPYWAGFNSLTPEVRLGHSRLDFRLSGPAGVCWVETKSVTLVQAGVARFPDAPTRRGQRHLEALTSAIQNGERCAVVFIVQRPDAHTFAAHRSADPDFAVALNAAATAGVSPRAYTCQVTRQELTLLAKIPVELADVHPPRLPVIGSS